MYLQRHSHLSVDSCITDILRCFFRWSFGVLVWEIVTFGKELVFYYFYF